MGGYQTRLSFVDPKFIDGEISAAQLKQSVPGARQISEFSIDRSTGDDDGDELLPAAAARRAARLSDWVIETPPEKLRVYAEIDRIIETQKVTADDWAGAELRNRAIVEAKAKDLYPDDRDDGNKEGGGVEPGWAERALPDYKPEPSTGFAAEPKRQRVSLKAQAAGRRLIAIEHQITHAKDDRGLVGRLLREAKDKLVPHGEFQTWVTDKLGMSPRTAREIMAEK